MEKPEELAQEELVKLVVDFLHRTVIHHGLWFAEAERQFGMAGALSLLEEVWPRSFGLQLRRLADFFGFALEGGGPAAIAALPKGRLLALLEELGKNWLAQDGIWFQAVEGRDGILDAKRCNDSCWVRFSPFEAASIRRFLGLSDRPGLDGLRQALAFRLYARINVQEAFWDGSGGLVFRMKDCRVQSARRRKGLADYPCKSAGLVEYRTFAETIDPRIRTSCLACPPDEHPPEWFCAWRFTIED